MKNLVAYCIIRATGKRVAYQYHDAWNKRYYSFDDFKTQSISRHEAFKLANPEDLDYIELNQSNN